MAVINFPSSPIDGQTYTQNGVYYVYDATVGAWLTNVIPRPLDVGQATNKQLIFNDAGVSNGSYGAIFDKSSNTVYFNSITAGNTVWQTVNSTNTAQYYRFGDGSTTYAAIGGYYDNSTNGHLEIYTLENGTLTEQIRVSNTGNVGIGTTNPKYILDIAGTINATGILINGAVPGLSTAKAYFFSGS